MTLTTGIVLQNGRYLISRVSGRSKLGISLEGIQTPSRPVLLKTLNPDLRAIANYSFIKERFTHQVSQFAQCHHPGLEQLLDTFEEQYVPFAVTDCTSGQTLAEVVASQGAFSASDAIRYVQQLGSALKSLHNHGLIHQTITPDNVIQPPGSEIVVLVNFDFTSSDWLNGNDRTTPLNKEYAAIEQYQSDSVLTPATDLYALAGVLYFLVTGCPPVAAPLRQHSAIVPPRQFCPQLNPELEAAILQGLELNRKDRPAAIADWLFQLSVALPTSPLDLPANGKLQSNIKPSEPSNRTGTQPSFNSPNPPTSYVPPMISLTASRRFSNTLLTTAMIAAAIGTGTGFILRLAATTTGPGTSFFHSEQSFPVLDGWPGKEQPIPSSVKLSPPVTPAPIQSSPAKDSASPAPAAPPEAAPVQETVVPAPEAPVPSPSPQAETTAPAESVPPVLAEPTPEAIVPAPPPQPAPIPAEPLPPAPGQPGLP